MPRRDFLRAAGTGVLASAAAFGKPAWAYAATHGKGEVPPVKLPPIAAPTERIGEPAAPQPAGRRVGFAVVALGRISLEEVLPGIVQSENCKLVALVSGSPDKAKGVAAQYDVPANRVFGYAQLEQLAHVPEVEAVYIALPDAMHAEFTIRAAKAGKHVLCEKPMASTVAECEAMIGACEDAGKLLMIAYRLQYEPHHRAAIRLVRSGDLGPARLLTADNVQNAGDPSQWRLKRAMGGGPLWDVGIYCLSAMRYLTGEEPVEAFAMQQRPAGDPRFREVEEGLAATLRFPSGAIGALSCSFGVHEQRSMRVMMPGGWIGMDPAFSYAGLRLQVGVARGDSEYVEERKLPQKSQFARELDHFADCIRTGRRPHTPGEEGMQDVRLITALYESARTGKPMTFAPVKGLDAFRGPAPDEPDATMLPEKRPTRPV